MAQFDLAGFGGTEKKKKKKLTPTLNIAKTNDVGFNKEYTPTNDKGFNKEANVTNDKGFSKLPGDNTPDVVEEKITPQVETVTVMPEKEKISATETIKEEPTVMDVRQSLADRKKQMKIDALRNRFSQVQASAEQERKQLDPLFNTATGQVRTEDTMARENARKVAAIGATGSGSLAQSNIAQNVITGGQMNQLRQQRVNMEDAINQKVQEAQLAMQQGVTTANQEAEIEQMQFQLQQMESQAAAELAKAELQDARQFDLYKKQLDVENEATLKLLDNDLKQQNLQIEAEIDNAMANNDLERAMILANQKSQNDVKLQAIKNSAAMQQIAARDTASKEQILLRESFNNQTQQQVAGGLPLDTINQSIENVIGRIPNPELDSLKQQLLTTNNTFERKRIQENIKLLQDSSVEGQQQKYAVMDTIYNNDQWFDENSQEGIENLMSVLALNGISPEEMNQFAENRDAGFASEENRLSSFNPITN